MKQGVSRLTMDALKAAVGAFLSKEVCSTYSPRYSRALQLAGSLREFLESSNDVSAATSLVSAIRECVRQTALYPKMTEKREKASVAFEEASLTLLPLYWEILFTQMGVSYQDPLLTQSVNDFAFENAFSQQFLTEGAAGRVSRVSATSIDHTMSADEMNALRYMCGFIPYKLLHKFGSSESGRCKALCRVLEQLRNSDPSTSDTSTSDTSTSEGKAMLDTSDTEAWLSRVNRGSLFQVTEAAFEFFRVIEKCVRDYLPPLLRRNEGTIESVRSAIMQNHDVTLFWTTLTSADETDCDILAELLSEIVSLFITIRGFAIAASWLERYKREKCLRVSKSRSLGNSINKSIKK